MGSPEVRCKPPVSTRSDSSMLSTGPRRPGVHWLPVSDLLSRWTFSYTLRRSQGTSLNRPPSVARGCASHCSVLGVMGSVALARGGGGFLLDGGLR